MDATETAIDHLRCNLFCCLLPFCYLLRVIRVRASCVVGGGSGVVSLPLCLPLCLPGLLGLSLPLGLRFGFRHRLSFGLGLPLLDRVDCGAPERDPPLYGRRWVGQSIGGRVAESIGTQIPATLVVYGSLDGPLFDRLLLLGLLWPVRADAFVPVQPDLLGAHVENVCGRWSGGRAVIL